MVRIAFALGGLGSGVCRNPADLKKLTQERFSPYQPSFNRRIFTRLERNRI